MLEKFHVKLRVITYITFLILPIFSFSQILNSDQPIDSSMAKPKAISVVKIIQNLQEVNSEIDLINKKIIRSSSINKIDSLLPKNNEFLNSQKSHVERFIKANPNRQKISNLIKKWSGYTDYLNKWQSTLNQDANRNIILLSEISFKQKTWELTYQNAIKKEAPPEIINRTKNVGDEIKNLKKTITKENNEFLILESQINNQKLIVENVINDLTRLKNSEIYNIFYLRHAPIWQLSYEKQEATKNREKEVESISENISQSLHFLKANHQQMHIFIVIIIITILLIRLLRKAFIKYDFNEEDGDLQNAKDVVLNHSYAVITFILLVIAKLFFNSSPMLIGDLLILLALLLSIQIIKPYMYKRFKKILYFIIVFYFLDALKTYVWFPTTTYRVYLLFEALLVIGALYFFTHPYKKIRRMKMGRFGTLLIKLIPYIYALAIISIVSNILGYTNLSDITLKICTRGCVYAIIFYGILMISDGIIIGIIHLRFNSKGDFDPIQKFKIELKALKINRIFTFIFWVVFFLKMIDLLTPVSEGITDFLTEPYQVGSITFTLGVVFNFILILIGSYFLTRIISIIFDDSNGKGVILNLLSLPKGIPAVISLIFRYLIIAFGITLALSSLGIDLSKFNLMAGALGIGIGFGLQTVISNFVSGIILVFERPMLPGDTVEVNNLLGTVSRIGVRSSSINTFDGAEVVVPNNNLISNDLINWTLSDNIKRVEVSIGTTYDADPNIVLQVLSDAAKETPGVLNKPAPLALFNDFGDSSLNFKLRFWVHYSLGLQAKSDVSIIIYNKFKELNIEIPFPQQDVHIKNLPDGFETSKSPNNSMDESLE